MASNGRASVRPYTPRDSCAGWFTKLLIVGAVGYTGYSAFDLHRGGFFSLPDIPDGAYPISFKGGLRGVETPMSPHRFHRL